MKITHHSIVLLAVLALPFSLSAQTTGGSSGSNGSSGSSSGSGSGSQNSNGSGANGSAPGGSSTGHPSSSGSAGQNNSSGNSDSSGSSGSTGHSNQPGASSSDYGTSSTGSSMGGEMAVQRISKDSLVGQLTAKDLIDTDVYDRDQKKIGKVVDVVLSNSSSTLGTAFSDSKNHGMANPSATSGTSASSNAARSAGTGGLDNSSYASSSGANASGTGSGMQPGSSGMSSQVFVVISHGGMLKMDKDYLRAPLSQLSYDSNQKRLTLNLSASDISGLTSVGMAGQ